MGIVVNGNTIYTAAASDDDVTTLTFIGFSVLPAGLGKDSTLSLGSWSAKVSDMRFTGDTYAWGPGTLYPIFSLTFDTPTQVAMPEKTGVTVS